MFTTPHDISPQSLVETYNFHVNLLRRRVFFRLHGCTPAITCSISGVHSSRSQFSLPTRCHMPCTLLRPLTIASLLDADPGLISRADSVYSSSLQYSISWFHCFFFLSNVPPRDRRNGGRREKKSGIRWLVCCYVQRHIFRFSFLSSYSIHSRSIMCSQRICR